MTRNTRKRATSSADADPTQAKKKKTDDVGDELTQKGKKGNKKAEKKQKKDR